MAPIFAIYLLWICWMVSWSVAAIWVNPTIKHGSLQYEAAYRVAALAAVVLLFGFYSTRYDMIDRFWRTPTGATGWMLVLLAALGLALSWWARVHLGPYWATTIARKDHHHIVKTGPYALIRHPMYLGVMLAVFATAALHGTPGSFLGAAILIVGGFIKLRLEERFLHEELGAYDAYAEHVAMLLPHPHWPQELHWPVWRH